MPEAAVEIRTAPADSPDALRLQAELSDVLRDLTGAGGEAGFDAAAMAQPRAVFAVAYEKGEAVGCGALRPLASAEDTAELKRLYARTGHAGVGGAVLCFLEGRAAALGYARIVAETRRVNARAAAFYTRHGYAPRPNYGSYAHRAEAVCFEKTLERGPQCPTEGEHR